MAARKTKDNASAVVALAKNQAKQAKQGAPIELSTGLGYAVFKPVSTVLITESLATVKDPPVPMWHNPDKDREEENPNHPDYIKALETAAIERSNRVIDAIVMFGVTLTDEDGSPVDLPEDASWLRKLQFLSKRGGVDLEGFDLKDDFDLEFLYKRYVALGQAELGIMTRMSGISEEDITRAEDTFPGNAQRGANKSAKSN
jgi:hypothetical protein